MENPLGGGRLREASLVLALLGLSLFLRTFDLRADPPLDLTWSAAPFTDEGVHTICARHWALHGDYAWRGKPWPWSYLPYAPVWNGVIYGVYRVAGVGLTQLRATGVACGMLYLVALWALVRARSGPRAGVIALFLAGLDYATVMHARMGVVESLVLLGQVGMMGLAFGGSRSRVAAGAAGLLAACVLVAKPFSGFLAIASFLFIAWGRGEEGRDPGGRLERALIFALGGIAGTGAWIFLWFLPKLHELQTTWSHAGGFVTWFASTPLETLRRVLLFTYESEYLDRAAVIAILTAGFLVLGMSRREARTGWRRFLLLGVLAWWGSMGVLGYRPLRYQLLGAPILIAAAGEVLEAGLRSRSATKVQWALSAALGWVFLAHLKWRFGISQAGYVGLLPLALVLAWAGWRLGSRRSAVVAICLHGAIGIAEYGRWAASRQHTIVGVTQSLRRAVPDSGVLLGQNLVTTVTIDHRCRVYSLAGRWEVDRVKTLVRELGVTHVFCARGDGDEGREWVAAHARAVGEYRVGGLRATLYEWVGEGGRK